jgi:hypothetical protein
MLPQFSAQPHDADLNRRTTVQLTINNIDYSQSVAAAEKFLIERRLNEPSLCSFTLAPQAVGLAVPARNTRVIVADDSGILLFTGYIATEPALGLLGQSDSGASYQVFISAVSDEILLDRQPLSQSQAGVSQPTNQLMQGLSARLGTAGIAFALAESNGTIGHFQANPAQPWSANAGALATIARSAYRVVNGTVTMMPIGTVTHTLSEAAGTLDLSGLSAGMVRALANDITVCGEEEPGAYVTEFFQGDGTTVLFDLARDPYVPPASKGKPLIDLFQQPTVDPSLWQVSDGGSHVSITAAGLTCTGGNGIDGDTNVSTVNQIELGGGLVLEAAGVLFGSMTQGVINGLYDGTISMSNCLAGFQINQVSGVTVIMPLVEGAAAGSIFTPIVGHMYTLRLRFYAVESQRALAAYNSIDSTGTHTFGGSYTACGASLLMEVQDTTNGVAAAPVVVYSGTIRIAPPTATLAILNSADLLCSIASIEVSQQGPVWVESTPPGGSAIVRRLGTTAEGADCHIERTGKLHFYATSVPVSGEMVAISYRIEHRSIARLANADSVVAESNGGTLPGTAAWMGTVTSPAPRSSVDCENAASALLDLSTNRGAAWQGKYTALNLEEQTDVWPGDVLAIDATAASIDANLVIRTVQIQMMPGAPGVTRYTIGFANDWANALAIKTSSTVPADAWLPQQPEAVLPLANLNALAVTSVTGSAIAVSANATPPASGGFEVRRRDWAFGPGTNSDLVLRSPVANFSIPRESVTEQYYIRMYDGSAPSNYSRFSYAVFVNAAL